tara:strand:+ start:50604 stop:51632 length:1029 start_codon:yes stop_codon:yes gene_type:complete
MKKLVLLILILSTISISAQRNLVKNGDFEMDLANWRGDVATISPFEKKTGKKSCLISQYVGAEWKGIDQIINIPKNTYAVEFSAWIKTDAIEGGKETYNTGLAALEFMTHSEANVSTENIAQVLGSTTWTLYKKLLVVPQSAKKIRIMLALAQTNGVIIYDNLKLIGISEETYIEKTKEEDESLKTPELNLNPKVLKNGDFEKGLEHWTGLGKIISYEKKEGTLSASIHLIDNGWVHIDQIADVVNGVKKIKFSGWLKAENIVQGAESWNNGLFIVEFTKDGTNKTTEDQVIGNVTGTTDWTFFEQTLTVPVGTMKYRIMLALSNCKGTLLVDDIQAIMLLE